MNHAIKEQISDTTLYVEVEPQPPEWVSFANEMEWPPPPISIGDTVNGRKVVGIEVIWGDANPKWFWKYSVEEIN